MKINIDISTYVFLLISFLAGYFEYMYILLLIIFIHESGHALFGMMVGFNKPTINIYPFGGITIFNEDLNVRIYKEFISLLGGITFQLLFYLLCLYLYKELFITNHVFEIIKRVNFLLISFNFMLILPLDGGKLLNIILDYFFSYKVSHIISIVFSIIFILLFIYTHNDLFSLIILSFLIKSVIIEAISLRTKYSLFLFERYKKEYNFKRIKFINSISSFKRDCTHIINNEFEKSILHKLFDRR